MMAEIALLIITLFTIILFVVSFAACADGYWVISCIGFMAVCIIMLCDRDWETTPQII